jgi:hypothetical protein
MFVAPSQPAEKDLVNTRWNACHWRLEGRGAPFEPSGMVLVIPCFIEGLQVILLQKLAFS